MTTEQIGNAVCNQRTTTTATNGIGDTKMATYKRTNASKISARPFPGWRTMTRAQRYNAKMDRIFEGAKDAQTRFNESSRTQSPTAV